MEATRPHGKHLLLHAFDEPRMSGIVECLPYWTLTKPHLCLASGNFLSGKYPERRID